MKSILLWAQHDSHCCEHVWVTYFQVIAEGFFIVTKHTLNIPNTSTRSGHCIPMSIHLVIWRLEKRTKIEIIVLGIGLIVSVQNLRFYEGIELKWNAFRKELLLNHSCWNLQFHCTGCFDLSSTLHALASSFVLQSSYIDRATMKLWTNILKQTPRSLLWIVLYSNASCQSAWSILTA